MNNNDERTLDFPDDIDLPFFAYGIFKPGQLAYSKIKRDVYRAENDVEVDYEMKLRDGVPILTDNEGYSGHTKGSIIVFKKGKQERAYAIICKTLLRALYEWKTIEIDGQKVNVVFGLNPNDGSYYIEDPYERACFEGKNDPFFREVIELIERNLDSNEFSWDVRNFFELQMNYMLLWSAIDRYSALKYNRPRNSWNYERFAQEKAFGQGIRKFNDESHRPVYSTEDLRIHEYDAENPIETIYYYYTLRCNVVHRGKAMASDYDMLKRATEELLEIFKEVLEDTFD